MDKLEKVELVREKAGVTYQDARDALEACDYDVLDAIIWLEERGKTEARTASYETVGTAGRASSPEMIEAQQEYHKSSKKTKFGEQWAKFYDVLKKLIREGLEMTFVAEREGARVVTIPLLFVIIGVIAWGLSIWLLIIGLFFGFRYKIEGANPVTIDVNDVMDKAADAAESVKSNFSTDEE